MSYFDTQSVAQEARISAKTAEKMIQRFRQEYPADAMMSELQLLRACVAIRDGLVPVEELLQARRSPEPYTVRCSCPAEWKCEKA